MTDTTQQIINWTIPLHNAKPGEEFITRSNGVAIYERTFTTEKLHKLYSVNDECGYTYEPNGQFYGNNGPHEDDLVLRKDLLKGAVAGDRFITRGGEVVKFIKYLQLPDNTEQALCEFIGHLQLPDNTEQALCGPSSQIKSYTLDGRWSTHLVTTLSDLDLISKVSRPEPEPELKRINVHDVPVGSEVRCRNGELLTVTINDGSDQPIYAENLDRVNDDGGKTSWWYFSDGRRNIDPKLGYNPWDIVEIARRGPEPPVSLEGVEVGDKLRTRNQGTLEVNLVADENGRGCIRAGLGFWYFKSGKLNLSKRVDGSYSGYDVIEVIKAPKPEPKKFNFNDDGGFVPGTLYETRGGDVYIYGKERTGYYPFALFPIGTDGEIGDYCISFRTDGSYLEDIPHHHLDIVRRIGPAKVTLPE
jgi:hypothetical protein